MLGTEWVKLHCDRNYRVIGAVNRDSTGELGRYRALQLRVSLSFAW